MKTAVIDNSTRHGSALQLNGLIRGLTMSIDFRPEGGRR